MLENPPRSEAMEVDLPLEETMALMRVLTTRHGPARLENSSHLVTAESSCHAAPRAPLPASPTLPPKSLLYRAPKRCSEAPTKSKSQSRRGRRHQATLPSHQTDGLPVKGPLRSRIAVGDTATPLPPIAQARRFFFYPVPDDMSVADLREELRLRIGPVSVLRVTDALADVRFQSPQGKRALNYMREMSIDGVRLLAWALPPIPTGQPSSAPHWRSAESSRTRSPPQELPPLRQPAPQRLPQPPSLVINPPTPSPSEPLSQAEVMEPSPSTGGSPPPASRAFSILTLPWGCEQSSQTAVGEGDEVVLVVRIQSADTESSTEEEL